MISLSNATEPLTPKQLLLTLIPALRKPGSHTLGEYTDFGRKYQVKFEVEAEKVLAFRGFSC